MKIKIIENKKNSTIVVDVTLDEYNGSNKKSFTEEKARNYLRDNNYINIGGCLQSPHISNFNKLLKGQWIFNVVNSKKSVDKDTPNLVKSTNSKRTNKKSS